MKKNHRNQNFRKRKEPLFRVWCLLMVIFLSFTNITAMEAQSNKVSGIVVSNTDDQPLIGVSVSVKGTSIGTVTDLEGQFTIQAEKGQSLVFTYVGFSSLETRVDNNNTVLQIRMKEDAELLDEVVVIGYGVQKKKLVTGATSQIKGDDLDKLSTTTALQALQGQAAGVNITSNSGQPGDPMKVVIRGVGTVGNSGPLYIVDGVQTDDITYLNNADIESVDVLKDAASAAIYGSRAANGVVLITTKQGKTGKGTVTFDAYYGWQNVPRKVDLLNSREYATIMNEAAVNSGKLPYFTNDEVNAMRDGTNWMDEMFAKNVPTQNYSLGLQGGSEFSTYSLSLSYTDQGGIIGGKDYSNYERYGFRANSEHKLYGDLIRFGEHLTFTYTNQKGVQVGNQYNNTLRSAFNTSPFLPMYDDDNNFYDSTNSSWYDGESNPYASMVYNNNNKTGTQKLIGDIYAEIRPLKDLTFKTVFGLDYSSSDYRSYTPIYQLSRYDFNNNSKVSQNMSKGTTWNWDNTLTYLFTLDKDHKFDVMGGTSMRKYTGSYLSANNADLIFDDFDHAWIKNATNQTLSLMGMDGYPYDEDMLLSYFGRLSYNYKETYMLTATFRADGSSKFSKDNRWGYFPSVSAGWIVTNEKFMQKTQDWLDFLKLRASWGQNGNQNIPAFQYMSPFAYTNANYNFGNEEGISTPGSYPSRLGNDNLKWETSEQLDFGLDARFLGDKINLNFDWYKKSTKDWLIQVPVLATAGTEAPYINGGNVVNKGVELGISYSDKVGKDFSYTVSGNFTYNKNEVTEIPSSDGTLPGLSNQIYDNSPAFYQNRTGYPIGYFWGYKTDGIFQTIEEVQAHTYKDAKTGETKLVQPNAQPGDVRFVDYDGDGLNDNDKVMIGDPNPDYLFGMTFSCKYKNFDFMVNASGVAGNQVVQSYRNITNSKANYTSSILDRWHGPGTSNTMPRVTEDNRNWVDFSDLYVQNGDYVRINNITLGYDFSRLLRQKYISQLRIYGTIQNLYTFTKYDGMDPEIGYGVGDGSSGLDVGFYPHPRTFLLGVNVRF